eukprot:TRINITY_DN3883_c0_g3_i1.p1 TRINITY_DN3883_c0_g3~~TRINITY_DN3883_c0_g3_i1.p1  ORF type:complete len:481 (-),score=48.98 TRINITY_DN3883_c0_g3_i1:212-1654(-)
MAICSAAVWASFLQLTSADGGGGHCSFHARQHGEELQEHVLQESGTSESCTNNYSIVSLQEYLSCTMKVVPLVDSTDELATPRAEISVHTPISNPEFFTDSSGVTFDLNEIISVSAPTLISMSRQSKSKQPRVPVEAVESHRVASAVQRRLAPAMTGQTDVVGAAWTTASEMLSTQRKTNLDMVEPSTNRVKQTPVVPFASARAAATLSAGAALSLLEASSRVTAAVVAKGATRVLGNPGLAVSLVVGAMAMSLVFANIVLSCDNLRAPDGKACSRQPEASTVDEPEKKDNLGGQLAIAQDGNRGTKIVLSEPPAAASRRKPFVPPLNLGNMSFPESAESVNPSIGGHDDADRPSMVLGISPSLSRLPRLQDWVRQHTTRQIQDTPSSSKPSSQMVLEAQTPHINENRPSCDTRRMSYGPSLRSSLTGESLAPPSRISLPPFGTQSSLTSSQGHWFAGSPMRHPMTSPMRSVPSESFFQS